MIFSFVYFPMKILSYKAIITGKGVVHINDSYNIKKLMTKIRKIKDLEKSSKMKKKKFPYM